MPDSARNVMMSCMQALPSPFCTSTSLSPDAQEVIGVPAAGVGAQICFSVDAATVQLQATCNRSSSDAVTLTSVAAALASGLGSLDTTFPEWSDLIQVLHCNTSGFAVDVVYIAIHCHHGQTACRSIQKR